MATKMRYRTSISDLQSSHFFHRHLSPFQVEKFSFFFNSFFDLEKNGLLERNDLDALIEKLRAYASWREDEVRYKHLQDVHRTWYSCIKDHILDEYLDEDVSEEECLIPWKDAFVRDQHINTNSMSLTQWLNMWGKLCYGSAGISDFPIWVQLLPSVFFDIIDRDCDGILSYDEIKNFYESLIGIKDPVKLERVSKEGYRVMTANGDYKLDKENYMFCFANFLLGKSIYGPGKYIFGVFDNRELDEKFSVAYNEDDQE